MNYKEIDAKQVEILASRGLNYSQIAQALGIDRGTLAKRREDDQQIQQAIKRGRAQGLAYVAGRLMKKIDEADLGAIIFYLKTQGGWKETQRIESDAVVRQEIPEGLDAIYAKLRRDHG